MPDKLPENIDQIEDFYKSSFNDEDETPPMELWGKIESRINTSTILPPNNFWKYGVLRLSIEALVLGYVIYCLQNPTINPQIPENQPAIIKEMPISKPQTPVFEDVQMKEEVQQPKTGAKSKDASDKMNVESKPSVLEETIVEPEKENVQEEILQPEPLPVAEPKKEVPVKEEPQDLYSKLKKKHVADSSKSLFIEKKK
ncbi:MAG: hypothetical protein H7329_03065 [Opitutaceae bacterium]|nr:hypothetical protein [Cytophagales bacterium]